MSRATAARTRGYKYEYDTVRTLNGIDGWRAWRLGGTTVELPDVIAVHNRERRLLVMELKATASAPAITIKSPQIERIIQWCANLAAYNVSQDAVIGFRFHRNRKHHEYYYKIDHITHYKCTDAGSLYKYLGNNWVAAPGLQYTLPHEKKMGLLGPC